MANIITKELKGEAISSYGTGEYAIYFKQEFEVKVDYSNFKYTIISRLYMKLASTYVTGGQVFKGLFQQISDDRYKTSKFSIMPSGVYDSNNKLISSNPYNYTKVMENSCSISCSSTGRFAIRLYCGWILGDGSSDANDQYILFDDYKYIYLTLPSFSGIKYKLNNSYNSSMPWIKVNGTWKRCLQYIKVNGAWKRYNDTWVWNP